MRTIRVAASFLILSAFAALLVVYNWPASVSSSLPEFIFEKIAKEDESVVFVGDIMLARDVERKINSFGIQYPLLEIGALLKADVLVGNFEASVPAVHEPTPNQAMKFSVAEPNLAVLVNGGFTHLSLANNHSLDHGYEGFQNTKSALAAKGFTAFGQANLLSTSSISIFEVNDKTFAIVGINATYGYPTLNTWLPVIGSAKASSDYQIVYIHWGEEYEPRHNLPQDQFAHSLVDAGVDLIVGHHPHVVQDIELYKNTLIFYSLGNFIFDQYWNDEVSQGLLLRLAVEDGWQISLHGVETKTVHIQPRPMAPDRQSAFLKSLADRSSPMLRDSILTGVISLQF